MNTPAPHRPENVVSLHPYFKLHPGKIDAFRELIERFIERTTSEDACLYYDFTLNGDIVHCREAYVGGEGALAHLENVDDLLKEGLAISDLERLEIHGSATELEKMRDPLAELPVEWFVFEKGLVRF